MDSEDGLIMYYQMIQPYMCYYKADETIYRLKPRVLLRRLKKLREDVEKGKDYLTLKRCFDRYYNPRKKTHYVSASVIPNKQRKKFEVISFNKTFFIEDYEMIGLRKTPVTKFLRRIHVL